MSACVSWDRCTITRRRNSYSARVAVGLSSVLKRWSKYGPAVLQFGHRAASVQLCPEQNASCVAPSSRCLELASLCACTRVLSRCPWSCELPLYDILVPELEHRASCTADDQCNARAGGGTCRDGRCHCAHGWGTWNCSFSNGQGVTANAWQGGGGKADFAFSENKYGRYYTNLSSITSKSLDSDPDGAAKRGVSLSGPGSNAEQTVGVRTALPVLLGLLGVRSIIDVPCGDFNYMRSVLTAPPTPPQLVYQGMDIVTTLVEQLQAAYGTEQGHAVSGNAKHHRISFARFDLSLEYLWPADLVVIRDVLFHFSASRVNEVRRRIALSGCRFALVTYFPRGNNKRSLSKFHPGHGFSSYASWNFEAEPFGLPPPLLTVGNDGPPCRGDGCRVMGLWQCSKLWNS